MRFDEYGLQKTAEAVFAMNPTVRECYDTPESFKSFMVSMAYQYLAKSTFCGTYGFYLSSYKLDDGNIEVRATVSPSLVTDYLAKQKEAA